MDCHLNFVSMANCILYGLQIVFPLPSMFSMQPFVLFQYCVGYCELPVHSTLLGGHSSTCTELQISDFNCSELYLSKLQIVFVKIANCICQNANYICKNCNQYFCVNCKLYLVGITVLAQQCIIQISIWVKLWASQFHSDWNLKYAQCEVSLLPECNIVRYCICNIVQRGMNIVQFIGGVRPENCEVIILRECNIVL